MSDLPLKPSAGAGHSAPLLSIAGSAPDSRYASQGIGMTVYEGRSGQTRVASEPMSPAQAAAAGQVASLTGAAILCHVFGLVLTIGAGLLAVLPEASWQSAVSRIGPLVTEDWARWLSVFILAMAGISFLPCKPISFVSIAGQAAICLYSADQLLAGFFSERLLGRMLPGWSCQALVIVSLTTAYLMLASRRSGTFSLRSTCGLILLALAALGTLKGWYNWSWLADKLGPDGAKLLTQWSQECTWAVLVIVTAIAVSFSRTRPVHLLMAVLLVALAVHCISTGMTRIHTFPELSSASHLVTIDHRSYENVAAWRWIVALELVCIACVLVHMACGMGALTLVCSLTWMFAGVAFYESISRMSLMRTAADPDVWKLVGNTNAIGDNSWLPPPNPATPGRPGASRATPRLLSDSEKQALATTQRQTIVGEVTPFAWMLLMAMFSGVIAACGVRMLTRSPPAQAMLRFIAWILFASAVFVSAANYYAHEGEFSWVKLATSAKYSRQHVGVFWVVFFGAAAIAGNWALSRGSVWASWVYAAAGCILLGTAATLVGAALLICYGGFPQLPTWTYAMIAALQSSMAWALLMYTNFAAQSFATSRVKH